MILVEGLDEDMFEDIADVTLIDEDTKPILTDDAKIHWQRCDDEVEFKWRHLLA